ncbi:unnamed protein product [Candidula unifasciata]|uniref:Tetraspanin n=1 Tax=Candidula unifasciata TaxID=100452 RepID=A0A8S3YZ00_9EUPU|nr:unnamed protein product [Candidula unifasciata]
MASVNLSKVVMVTINVIFLIFGIAALAVGIVFKLGWNDVREAFIDVSDKVEFDLQSAGDILGYTGIIIGAFIIIVSLLGCIGACCTLRILLGLYSIIVLILVAAEIALVALVATHADQTKESVSKAMNDSLSGRYYENSTNDISKAYSALFSKLECCGISNYSENFPYDSGSKRNRGFIAAPQRQLSGAITAEYIPITCCKDFDYKAVLTNEIFVKQEQCLNSIPNPKFAYTEGCLDTLIDKIKDNKSILIGVGVAILVLEFTQSSCGYLRIRHALDNHESIFQSRDDTVVSEVSSPERLNP